MKRLGILRHAKSSWDSPDLDDFNRPLNPRGWEAARRIGREMAARGIRFDRVIASMAARVRETIDGVQEEYDFRAPITFDPNLYMADPETLLRVVRRVDDQANSALIVGHNPGLGWLAAHLTKADAKGFRQRVLTKFPTAAFALIELPIDQWSEGQTGIGKIVELILPRELD